MKLLLIGHNNRYNIEQLCAALLPGTKLELTDVPFPGDGIVSKLSVGEKWATATASVTRSGLTFRGLARCPRDAGEREYRYIEGKSLYRAILPLLDEAPSWGSLSGVRPSKPISRLLLAGKSRAEADRYLRDRYEVSDERRRLCLDAAEGTLRAFRQQESGDISLYVGIPFCPTRCIYCSFVSAAIEKSRKLLPAYLDALDREIDAAAAGLKKNPRRIRTVYIGGGTPTTLSARELGHLMEHLRSSLGLSGCIEFTVEAGRPDTLDPEKLNIIRTFGASRISINPQTMNDSVLSLLGRSHSSLDILRAWEEARAAGHDNINMDLIAGLPGDTEESFRATLDRVLTLGPENITVHTLALKKAATLYYQEKTFLPDGKAVANMLDYANSALRAGGYAPYYLYRQKYMTGSFENVGWTRPGYDNLYNIYMMEELHSILSLGSGGITKIISGSKISRLSNPKYPQEYIRDIDKICLSKEDICL